MVLLFFSSVLAQLYSQSQIALLESSAKVLIGATGPTSRFLVSLLKAPTPRAGTDQQCIGKKVEVLNF